MIGIKEDAGRTQNTSLWGALLLAPFVDGRFRPTTTRGDTAPVTYPRGLAGLGRAKPNSGEAESVERFRNQQAIERTKSK